MAKNQPQGAPNEVRTTIREDKLKSDLLTRLKRIEGQVKGVTRMVAEDVYCDNILHQISAIRAALDGVGKQVLENHLRGCLVDRIQAGEGEVVDELLVTIKTLLKY
jgi:CsoR family transcriptional regulator, copper-sensing transcriptional repressor